MKLSRTKEYNFGWLVFVGLVDVTFLLVLFLLLSSNFILQPGIAVSLPFSRFSLGPQINQQIISITGGSAPTIYFRDQKITLDQLGPLLDAAKREGRSIIIFLTISLIAHALCFYVFQIVYPPTVALLPPPARVSVIAPDSEEGRTLLRWIDAEDPALAFTTQRPPEARLRALPAVEHIPSYRAAEPALKEVPPLALDLRIPSAQPLGAVPFVHREAAPAFGPAATSVSFSKELDTFGTPTLPKPSFAASNDEPPQTVRFRVAVSGNGEIRYSFP